MNIKRSDSTCRGILQALSCIGLRFHENNEYFIHDYCSWDFNPEWQIYISTIFFNLNTEAESSFKRFLNIEAESSSQRLLNIEEEHSSQRLLNIETEYSPKRHLNIEAEHSSERLPTNLAKALHGVTKQEHP
jgi:hypothetical protein